MEKSEDTCASPKKRFIELSSFYTNSQDDPFIKMKIEDYSFLESVPNRSSCPKCNRSRKYYCYTCYVAVKEVAERLPVVRLPIKIDIIKHPKEVDGKSTAAHAAVLASEDVTVYTYPDFPSYETEEVLLVFPSKNALPFHDWWNLKVQSNTKDYPDCDFKENIYESQSIEKNFVNKTVTKFNCHVKKIIFIDSTWRQSKSLYCDPRLQKLQCVVLNSQKSLFWRHQRGKPDTYLATVEAVYYFLLEFHKLMFPEQEYRGQYDNMLFFFKYMYFKIKDVYDVS